MPDSKSGEFRGNRNLKRLKRISWKKQEAEVKRSLEFVLEPLILAIPSTRPPTLTTAVTGLPARRCVPKTASLN